MEIKSSTREEYLKRVNVVVDYINNHLDEELDLQKLAEMSNLSTYHFHRIMKAFLGETLGAYIIRVRLETAVRLLRYTDLPVEQIAYSVGYEMPSSLSKSFKQFYDITPLEYRNNKNFVIMKPVQLNPDLNLKSPKVIDIETKKAIYIRLTGAYSELDFCGAWGKLWAYVKENKLFSAGIEHISIYHDDPKVTNSEKLRTDVCLVLPKPAEPKGEIGVKEIAGGKYAVFSYQGPYTNLGIVYDTIFAKWLPDSGYELRNAPLYEKYINDPSRTEEAKLKTEIYIPLQ
ncbi:transcriptional regulator, AraC family [Bacteroides luti]|uniref:Transcriptional regulator, AraC family n=1 Tax=Bacteroides luti TaxID=1297750 RepID=A0A1M5BAG3_9BACE|nr:AraC family transcriptional regulator [Bacteroides luti]SHF39172.1 transcriptional regulator, AraC family [Bacteroides luti]